MNITAISVDQCNDAYMRFLGESEMKILFPDGFMKEEKICSGRKEAGQDICDVSKRVNDIKQVYYA